MTTSNHAVTLDKFVGSIWKDEIEHYLRKEDRAHQIEEILKFPVRSHDLGTYSFAEIIGLNPQRARYLLDYVHQMELPGFSCLTMDRAAAHRFVTEFGGLYLLYKIEPENSLLQDRFETQDVISRGTVSVRYPIPHRRFSRKKTWARHEKIERVRVKLNLPLYPIELDKALKYAKYDGFVSETQSQHNNWQWLTEMREVYEEDRESEQYPGADILMMYSGVPSKIGKTDYGKTDSTVFTQHQGTARQPSSMNAVLIRLLKYRVKEFPVKGDEDGAGDIFYGGYYGLVDSDNNPLTERGFMREEFGFICNGAHSIDSQGRRGSLSKWDRIAIEAFREGGYRA